ncbi:hypothetical protein FBU30_005599 [Linnemannia zychae]|nr:hypothetical protein FBU30_005599 [Linnemannia zychae]
MTEICSKQVTRNNNNNAGRDAHSSSSSSSTSQPLADITMNKLHLLGACGFCAQDFFTYGLKVVWTESGKDARREQSRPFPCRTTRDQPTQFNAFIDLDDYTSTVTDSFEERELQEEKVELMVRQEPELQKEVNRLVPSFPSAMLDPTLKVLHDFYKDVDARKQEAWRAYQASQQADWAALLSALNDSVKSFNESMRILR